MGTLGHGRQTACVLKSASLSQWVHDRRVTSAIILTRGLSSWKARFDTQADHQVPPRA
jgi:hypothetical protein